MRFAAGIRQACISTSEVSLARMPSLSSFFPADSPGVPRSTTNAEIPLGPRDLSVTAITTRASAVAPWVMKHLAPSSTQSSPSRRAVVRMAAASLPEPGSVSPHAASIVPCAIGTT